MTIQDINESLTGFTKRLNEFVANVEFDHYREFVLDGTLGRIYDSSFKFQGIYRFEIHTEDNGIDVKDWMASFTEDWKNTKVIWVPGVRKCRVQWHKELPQWLPIYIGKSRQVATRVNDHLHQKGNKHSFGMKLLGRENLYGRRFRVSCIPLATEHYDIVAPSVEKALRNRFHPILGKQ